MQYLLFKQKATRQQLQMQVNDLLTGNAYEKLHIQIQRAVAILQNFIKHDSDQQKCFFLNYETLISVIHEYSEDQSINLALHWINLYGQRLFEVHKLKQAKQVFQCILNYLQNPLIDQLLLCVALSNLCLFYKYEENYSKSLKYLLQIVQISVQQIKYPKSTERLTEKNYIQSFSIILVNSFKNGKNILLKMLDNQNIILQEKQEYYELLSVFDRLGYQACLNYLGKKSYFSKYFKPIQKQKVVRQQNIIKSFQQKMIQKLQNIENILKQRQANFIQQKIVFKEQQPELQQIQQLKQSQQKQIQLKQQFPINNLASGLLNYFAKGNTIDSESLYIKGWIVQIQLNKMFGQKIGKLEFKCLHQSKNRQFVEKIYQEKLEKILSLISLQDTLPYEYSIDDLPTNFISACIKPYFSITQEGNLEFFPKSRGILNRFLQYKFFKCNCLITLNYIRGNQFRMSISPIQQSGSVFLNIELKKETLEQLFQQLIDQTPPKIIQLYQKSRLNKKNKIDQKNIIQKRSIKVKNFQLIQKTIKQILSKFQQFLYNEHDELTSEDILSLVQKDEWYFKFMESESLKKGVFYRVKFFNATRNFSVYFQQQSIEKSKKSNQFCKRKGSSMFSHHQFQSVFGFKAIYQQIKSKLKRVQQIICKKYYLNMKKYQQEILMQSTPPSELCQNYMLQRSFNFHCFRVQFITNTLEDNYLSLITASIVTINNIIPIGIKINFYDPENIQAKGYFINIYCQDWRFQNYFKQKGQILEFSYLSQHENNGKQMLKIHKQKYSYSVEYFIEYWMKNEGFKLILDKVIDKNSKLYLQNNINQIVGWQKIFQ